MRRTLSALACCVLASCATPNSMGLSSTTPAVDVSQKSLLLMTMTLSHRNSTERAPKLAALNIERPNAQDKADRQNFIPDGAGRIVAATGFIRVFPFIAQFRSHLSLI